MVKIERVAGFVPTRSWGSAFKDLVWAIGMSDACCISGDVHFSILFHVSEYTMQDFITRHYS